MQAKSNLQICYMSNCSFLNEQYFYTKKLGKEEKMGRRIMTVDELYSFCLKNNFLNFDSKEFGKELVVEMPANFEKLNDDTDKMTEGLTPFVSRAFHDHINLNKSEIKEQDFKDNLPSSNLRPILANIKKRDSIIIKRYLLKIFMLNKDK